MISNIVFDMGQVLVNFEPMKACEEYLQNPQEQKHMYEAVFASPEWQLLDAGAISTGEALARMQGRLPNVRLREAARDIMENWYDIALTKKPGVEELLERLKAKGFNLYVLSNVAIGMREHAYRIPRSELFSGMLFSAEERLVKPSREIFERFFEKFSLAPEACIFIDDLERNVEGAKACGMEAYWHSDGDPKTLETVLEKLNR